MINLVTKLGDPVLRQKTEQLSEITDKEVSLVNKMRFVLSKVDGYGLAAPQIGVSKPIFVYNIGEGFNVIINPRVAEFDDSFWFYDEGCLSIPGFTFPIWRPKRALLRGIDLDGNDVRIEADGLLSRLFQHELDHINGRLVIDLLTDEERKDFNVLWRDRKTIKKKKRR